MAIPATRQEPGAHGSDAGVTSLPAAVQAYLRGGYSALSHSIVDYCMPKLSGAEFKLLIFFLRSTVGEREKRIQGDLSVRTPLDKLCVCTGMNREAAIAAIRHLESRGLLTAGRAHRQTTVYSLNLVTLLDPWVGPADSRGEVRIGKPDLKNRLESVKPTQNGTFESAFPTPYKEINKAAAAAIPISRPKPTTTDLDEVDLLEIRRISEATGIRIDGKDAFNLAAGVDRAGLTLAHLRWFLSGDPFSSARSPRAVLLTIVREFAERSRGISWPVSLEPQPQQSRRGLTQEELLAL